MIFKNKVGIISFGSSLPDFKINISEIEQAQGKPLGSVKKGLLINQKTVPNSDEDSATLATEASLEALQRLKKIDRKKIGVLFIGSESHPYAVKPTGTIVKQALDLSDELALADLQFACKAGTQALQIALNYLEAGTTENALAIGVDTAQSAPGDALEFSAGAGAGAFLLGTDPANIILKIISSNSIATDTPDFWRRPHESFPQHAGRFTGDPAYFYHVMTASQKTMTESNLTPSQINYCIFHTPNGKFPRDVTKKLGFLPAQIEPSLIVNKIGNTYAGASLLALIALLENTNNLAKLKPGQKILLTSYGSGAGADSFLFEVTENLPVYLKNISSHRLSDKIQNLKSISYAKYLQLGNH